MKGISGTLILCIFSTCLGSSLLMGYNLGVINLPSTNIKSYLSDYCNTTNRTAVDADFLYGQVSSVFVACAAMAALASGWVADRLGRNRSLMINNLIGIVGSITASICLSAQQPGLLYVGRGISGINGGLSVGIASMLLTEIAPRHLRGAIGACNQLAITAGILISYIVTTKQLLNTETLWPIALGIGAIPAFVALLLSSFGVESPRWLYLVRKDENGARQAFIKVNGPDNVDAFVEEMRGEMEATRKQKKFRFFELFRRKDLRMPVLIAVLIQVLQQLSGINAVIANSNEMLKAASVSQNLLQYFVVAIGALNVIVTIVAIPLLEKAGRRTLLLWPTLAMAIILILLTVFVSLVNNGPEDLKLHFGLTSAVLVFLYTAAFALGLGPIPALIVAEIFRQESRAAAYSLSQCIQWACNLLVVASFPSLNTAMKGYVYLPYLVVVVACWIFFLLFMPETKNRSFDDIAADLAVVGRKGAETSMSGSSVEMAEK